MAPRPQRKAQSGTPKAAHRCRREKPKAAHPKRHTATAEAGQVLPLSTTINAEPPAGSYTAASGDLAVYRTETGSWGGTTGQHEKIIVTGPERALTHGHEAGYGRALTAKNNTGHSTLSSCSIPLRVQAGGYPSLHLTVHLRISASSPNRVFLFLKKKSQFKKKHYAAARVQLKRTGTNVFS